MQYNSSLDTLVESHSREASNEIISLFPHFFSGGFILVAAIIAVVALVVAVVIFKDNIAAFFQQQVLGGLGELGGSASATLLDPIRAAGEAAGRAEAERKEQEQIDRAERDIEKAALDQGFSSIEEFNKATDSGSIVIGGTRTVVDFGLIGDVIPTDPSPEFIAANPLLFPTRGTTRFGGQRL